MDRFISVNFDPSFGKGAACYAEDQMKGILNGMGNMNVAHKEVFAKHFMNTNGEFLKRTSEKAEKIIKHKLQDILDGNLEVGVSYDDPDATFLTGQELESRVLERQWVLGLDYKPMDPRFTHLSAWMRDIFRGNFPNFVMHLRGLSMEEIRRKLEMRESLMKRSAIFHVVLGAAMLTPMAEDVSSGHIRILEKILDFGARVNVKDVSGDSPLHHGIVFVEDEKVKKTLLIMLRMMLEKGGDPNIQDRHGMVPLFECLRRPMAGESAKLLLEFGADPTIKNVDGSCPLTASTNSPHLQDIFASYYKKAVKKERKVAKANEDYKKCETCKSPANKRCSECFLAWYCSGVCQKEDWPNHKVVCKARKLEYIQVDDILNSWSGLQKTCYQVVKIKMSYSFEDELLHINNKDKSISGVTEKRTTGSTGSILFNAIKSKGFKGTQGYFSSLMKKGVLYVHPAILPPETW